MDYTIAAIDRALKLLEIVAENQNIGLSELARLTGTTKTLAFRMAIAVSDDDLPRCFRFKSSHQETCIAFRQ
jgi:hypothetical protein